LSKHGYKVRAKFFLEFDDFEDNFNHCILPLFEELGQVNDSNKAELEAHAQQFWSSFKEWKLDFEQRQPEINQFFQNVANNFQQNYKNWSTPIFYYILRHKQKRVLITPT
jgi:hypothetical protein